MTKKELKKAVFKKDILKYISLDRYLFIKERIKALKKKCRVLTKSKNTI